MCRQALTNFVEFPFLTTKHIYIFSLSDSDTPFDHGNMTSGASLLPSLVAEGLAIVENNACYSELCY